MGVLVPGGDVAVYRCVGGYAHQLPEPRIVEKRGKERGEKMTVFFEAGRRKFEDGVYM